MLRFRNEAPQQPLDEFRAARQPAAARHSAGEVALAIIVPAAGHDSAIAPQQNGVVKSSGNLLVAQNRD